jgi:excisionase family DNA binding protein
MATKTHVTPCLVDVKDAAQMLAVSDRTIWRLVEIGQLPAPVHLGRSARWPVADLLSYVDSLREQAGAY